MAAQHLVGIALQQLVPGAVAVARFSTPVSDLTANAASALLSPALKFLRTRLDDQSAHVIAAVDAATDRAWRALELVLAGDALWDRLKGALAAADVKAFRHDVRGLLAAAGVDGGYPIDRRTAARELRAARKAGLLQPVGLTPAGMVDSVGVFSRFDDPGELAAAQWRAVDAVAATLKANGHATLAAVVAFRPAGASLPLLGVAVRYFFRRAVEQDAELARGLSFARLEGLAEAQQRRFEALDQLIAGQADRLDAALREVAAEVAEVKAMALDIRAEQDRLGDQNRQIMDAVLALQAKLDQAGRAVVRPQDSLSVRTDAERDLVRKVIAQYRGLPDAVRVARPALRNAVGMLEVAAGDFAAARSDFAAVAVAVADPAARGEAHMNAYRAALEARDWPGALRELMAAGLIDGRRFAPFPIGKYAPLRILGAGGFGVAYLCRHKYMDAEVVVKTLFTGGSDRDFEAVFAEARAAAGIHHPGIVRVTDCGYVDPATKDRPFVVMDYFPGQALDEYVRGHGPIPADQLVPLARALAGALGAAHQKGILHRDVKPGNVLVRATGDGFEVRVIDFGLAVQHRPATGGSTSRSAKTLIGESIAGTLGYAAPEQMGGTAARVGPYSDVYGWAKTCCFALFQTAQPTLRHWQEISPGLAALLGRCLEDSPADRPQSFADVTAALDGPGVGVRPVVVEGRKLEAAEASPRPARATPVEPDDDDDAGPRGRRRRAARGRPPTRARRDRDQGSAFPLWAGVVVAVAVVVAIAVVAGVGLSRKKATDSEQASVFGPDNGPGLITPSGPVNAPRPGRSVGQLDVPGVGHAGGPPPRQQWAWPGGPPGALPELPAGWKVTKALGGAFPPKDFIDYRQDGSYLIGFEVGLGKVFNTDIISYLQPIWRTPNGNQMGTAYGTKPTYLWTVKAKDGYALGGTAVAGGGALEGICFTFMRGNGAKGLDPNDWYTTEWFGEQSRRPGKDEMRVGDGSLVVGIHGRRFEDKGGKQFDNGGAIGSIGLVIVPPKD